MASINPTPLQLHSLPILHSQSKNLFMKTRRMILSSPAIFLILSSSPARSENIPLFGIRKKLKKIEEEAEEVIEEGIVAAEKEVEEGIAAAVEGVGVLGDFVQAGAVAGAELIGVLVGLSVVDGILGPDER